jgi:radical SAM protein with 4Fe4S-binding SPASM domain
MKTRGVDQLEKIHEAVHTILRLRGDKRIPRIGVSFTENNDNLFQRQEFIDYWIQHVDVIRVNKMYEDNGSIKGFTPPAKRYPCNVLYDTMYANHKGQVSVCCLDGFSKTNIGNILKDGIEGTWNGDQFTKIRELHEAGRWDEVPMCKGCQVWTKDEYVDHRTDNLLIRESSLMSYYNRLDRMSTWVNPPTINVESTRVEL